MMIRNVTVKITLIIPDLHLRWEHANKIINHVKADEIIFLGDFFDNFGDDPNQVEEMIDWLEDSVTKSNRIHLFGNHDIHYAYPHEHFRCSGYDQWKHFIIRDRLPTKFWEKLKYYHVLDGKWLISHGGFDNRYLPKDIANLRENRPEFFKRITGYLDTTLETGHRQDSWILHAGKSRGGQHPAGGLIWCDFDREFQPITGLNQIVGHTPQRGFANWCHVKTKFPNKTYYSCKDWWPNENDLNDVNQSFNIDLDVNKNTHWGVWDGITLKVYNYLEDLTSPPIP